MSRPEFSGYKGMWLFAMFDLPVDTKPARRHYTQFRTFLLKLGFSMLQFSVYGRYFADEPSSIPYRKRIRLVLPPHGQVRLLLVTDHQFGKMESFVGKTTEQVEQPPRQLLLF